MSPAHAMSTVERSGGELQTRPAIPMTTQPMLRVVRIIARLNVGGPAKHVVWLTDSLRNQGIPTILVTGTLPCGEADMSDFARAHGISPVVIPEMSREISPRDLITLWKLFRLFRRFAPDIIHTHTAKAGAVGRVAGWLYRWATPRALLGRPRGTRFVHTFHGHIFHGYYGPWRTRLFVLLERALARITDRIVVLSDQQRAEIHNHYGVGRAAQFCVVPLGIQLEDPKVPRRTRAGGTIVIGIVGRLAPIKNHDLFLRAAARLGSLQARFVVYGGGGERPRLEALGHALGLGDRLRFAGTRPASEIYAELDIVALSSRNEGTPLALIEAMAAGLPIVSTAVGGVVDLLGPVEHSVRAGAAVYEVRSCGLTVPSGDEDGFAAALGALTEDAAMRAQLGARGREIACARHSRERLADDVLRIYQQLVLD